MRIAGRTIRPLRFLRRRFGRDTRLEALRQAFAPLPVNPDAIERVAVAPRHRILYNRIQKNANSSVITLIDYMESGQLKSVMRARDAVPHLDGWPAARMGELTKFRSLVVVRDPFSRVLSAFLDKFSTDRIRKRHDDFTLDPEGFGRFLHWLSEGNLRHNGHWDLQTRQILLPLSAFSHVARFETLDADLDRLLTEIGADIEHLKDVGALRRGRKHKTDAQGRAAQFYTPDRVRLVADLFATDFEALGYDPQRSPLQGG